MQSPDDGDFVVIFVSADSSAADMKKYMEEENMPWPAVHYGSIREKLLAGYGIRGIPSLYILDKDNDTLNDHLPPQTIILNHTLNNHLPPSPAALHPRCAKVRRIASSTVSRFLPVSSARNRRTK